LEEIPAVPLPKLGAMLVDQLLQAEGGERRPPGMVLVGDRRPEDGHEAVAQELVDRPLVAVDLGEGELEEAVEQQVHRLRPQPLGERRRPHEVAEDDRDLLALPSRAARDERTWEARWDGV
jgi:hypothetical protein